METSLPVIGPEGGDLSLGQLLDVTQLDRSAVLVLRHTLTPDGLATREEAHGDRLMAYVRRQDLTAHKFPQEPPSLWLNFLADGGLRSRFLIAYTNDGEVVSERTSDRRFYDLRPSPVWGSLRNRLVVEWTTDPVNWAKRANHADRMRVLEIADPHKRGFPGFDRVLITYAELQQMVDDASYEHWRAALSAVQGIYLILDSSSGRQYVGKTSGTGGILGRWTDYARTGHGGNQDLRELVARDPSAASAFRFSILRVYGPQATPAELDAAESHFKNALGTRQFGHNLN